MNELVCIRQRFHKSFLCVRRSKRHLNVSPKCLSSRTSHAFASFFFLRSRRGEGGGGGWYLRMWVSLNICLIGCSHNVQSRA